MPARILATVLAPLRAAPEELRTDPSLPASLRAPTLALQDPLQAVIHLKPDWLVGMRHWPCRWSSGTWPDGFWQLPDNSLEGLQSFPLVIVRFFGVVD
jgi:hypothetical protein